MGNGGGMANMTFVINGKSFDMNRIDEIINLSEGDIEIWSIQNMSPMAHHSMYMQSSGRFLTLAGRVLCWYNLMKQFALSGALILR